MSACTHLSSITFTFTWKKSIPQDRLGNEATLISRNKLNISVYNLTWILTACAEEVFYPLVITTVTTHIVNGSSASNSLDPIRFISAMKDAISITASNSK
jgi:hypothetical protein